MISFRKPGDRYLDAGRLGLGRRPAQRAAAGPASRRAGGGAQVREVRSGEAFALMAKARRAQRLHSADRAAHDARGAESARAATPSSCARIGSGGESLGVEDAGMGQVRVRPRRSTSSTARPNAIWCSRSCAALGVSRPGAIGKPVPGHNVAVIGADGQSAESRRDSGRSRCKRPDPVMFLRILGQAGSHA